MTEEQKPCGAGRSSFDLIESRLFFEALPLEPSAVFLDIGAGRGNYALPVAERLTSGGKVYALDAWPEGLTDLRGRASDHGLPVETLLADVNAGIPLPDATVDICLMATVLHDILREGSGEVPLRETARVLRPMGVLAIVEFKKVDSPGPPLAVRLSADDVEEVVTPYGFRKERVVDIGPLHYLFMARCEA